MFTAFVLIIAGVLVAAAFLFHRRSSRAGGSARGGWYGLALMGALFVGLVVSGEMGYEATAYGFGLAIVVLLLFLLLMGLAGAVGRMLRKRRKDAPP